MLHSGSHVLYVRAKNEARREEWTIKRISPTDSRRRVHRVTQIGGGGCLSSHVYVINPPSSYSPFKKPKQHLQSAACDADPPPGGNIEPETPERGSEFTSCWIYNVQERSGLSLTLCGASWESESAEYRLRVMTSEPQRGNLIFKACWGLITLEKKALFPSCSWI